MAPSERIPPPRTGPPAQVGRYEVAVAASVLRWDGCRLRLSLWGDRPAVGVRLASDRIVLDPEGAARGIDARRRLRLTEVEAAVLERPAPVLAVLTASGSVVLLPSSAVSGLLSAGGAHG